MVRCLGFHWVVGVPIQCQGNSPRCDRRDFAKLVDVQFAVGDGAVDVGCGVMTEELLDIIVRDCTVYD